LCCYGSVILRLTDLGIVQVHIPRYPQPFTSVHSNDATPLLTISMLCAVQLLDFHWRGPARRCAALLDPIGQLGAFQGSLGPPIQCASLAEVANNLFEPLHSESSSRSLLEILSGRNAPKRKGCPFHF